MKEATRWVGSLAVVLTIHAAGIGFALGWSHQEPPGTPPAAAMLELAPMPAAPAATPTDAEATRKLKEAIPDPQEPPPVELQRMNIEVATAEPPPPVSIPLAEVVLPPPEPPPPVELKPPTRPAERPRPTPPRPRPATAAPQAAPEPSRQAAAPAPAAAASMPSSASLPNWKGALLRHLERHKRYPREAQRERQGGVAVVRFTMSREGRVLAARIERASGVSALDKEALDLLQRAQPLPALPPDQPGESLELIVPIQFRLIE